MRKFNAFTLAEVLITLGIIGVVAAMTMPTLINQTNGAQYKAAYKKALSAIAQGVTLNVALDDVSFADTVAAGETSVISKGTDDAASIGSLLNSRMNVVKSATEAGYTMTGVGTSATVCKIPAGGTERPASCEDSEKETITVGTPSAYLFFNDGSMFAYDRSKYGCNSTTPCAGIVDVNGAKGPNKMTTDANKPQDIYNVVFYDQTILPGDEAAKGVLYGK